MGDWGTNGTGPEAGCRRDGAVRQRGGKTFDGMLLVGDNFYMNLPGGIKDPMWQSAFEKMYDPESPELSRSTRRWEITIIRMQGCDRAGICQG